MAKTKRRSASRSGQTIASMLRTSGLDEDAMRELELYVDNDGQLYHSMTQSIERNLLLKMARGAYDRDRAPIAWVHLLEAGARKYAREFGGQWSTIFPKAERDALAVDYAQNFESAVANGEMRHVLSALPKKYQRPGVFEEVVRVARAAARGPVRGLGGSR